uniref:Uncharacterized protein n=1 Tax=Florenciella sp. virus SA2 TaxID=3240092 RepID=A0AB39JDL4_9VIRU
MIIPSSFAMKTKIVTTLVAPHGITDLIHSMQNETIKPLISINSACILGSVLTSNQNIHFPINDIFFIISSIVHFRHDFSFAKQYNMDILCSIFTIYLFVMNHSLFFPYMILLHLPNHYKNNWKYIKKNKPVNFFIIFGFTLITSIFGNNILNHPLILYDIYKGIVISHIIYGELYIK